MQPRSSSPPTCCQPRSTPRAEGKAKTLSPEGSVALGGAWTCRQNRARRMRWEAGGTHPDSRGAFSSGPSSAPCPPPDPPRESSSRRRNGSTRGAPCLSSRELSRLFVAAKASARSAPLRCSGPRRAALLSLAFLFQLPRRGGEGAARGPPSARPALTSPAFPRLPSPAPPPTPSRWEGCGAGLCGS